MPHSFWLVIATTPWWMYLLFAILIRISLLVTKPRLVKMTFLYIMLIPLFVFTLIACYVIPPSKEALMIALPLFIMGSLFNIIRLRWQSIKALQHHHQLLLPGSWLMFCMILLLVFARQYILYYYNNDFSFNEWIIQHAAHLFLPLYALSIGLTIGQVTYFRWLLQHGPSATADDLRNLA